MHGGTLTRRRPRSRAPTRTEIEPAALDLIARYGPQVLGTARRYAATPEDAEDAYQRGLEILLTKAPSTREEELLPWLRTVVKHEAFNLRRQRERHGTPAEREELVPVAGEAAGTEAQTERLERLRIGAEAMGRLKPQEVRCLLLRAEGLSYDQICEATGFSYTKVNRCLAEGRRAFLDGIRRIESGTECERLRPLLSRLADGEANADDMRDLRPHLRSCLACRAALRGYRAAPGGLAAAVPGGVVAGGGANPVESLVHAIAAWFDGRAAGVALRVQQLVEAPGAQKLAAAAASSAAIAGGGAAAVGALDADDVRVERPAVGLERRVDVPARPTPLLPKRRALSAASRPAARAASRGVHLDRPAPRVPATGPSTAAPPSSYEAGEGEFDPMADDPDAPAPSAARARAGGSGAAGEFGP